MATKERLHRLVDELPEGDVPAAEKALARIQALGGMGGHKVAVEEFPGGFVAYVPTLDVQAHGRTPEDLESRLREALELRRAEHPEEVDAVLRYMGRPGDPVARSLWSAPFDDEPVTDADRRAIDEAWEEVRRGETIPHEEIKREFGIS